MEENLRGVFRVPLTAEPWPLYTVRTHRFLQDCPGRGSYLEMASLINGRKMHRPQEVSLSFSQMV